MIEQGCGSDGPGVPLIHRPSLGAHRLLGQGMGAALIRPNGEVDWWCPNRFGATPVLWRLLDADGGFAGWHDVAMATWDGLPAGPTARTVVRHHGVRIDLWDGLLAVGTSSVLIRLARSTGPACEMTHVMRCGGFGETPTAWHLLHDAATNGAVTISGAHHRLGEDGRLVVTAVAVGEHWNGLAIAIGTGSSAQSTPLSRDDMVTLMERAEADEAQFIDNVQLPRDHASRATDALRVLRALTDPCSGAPVASPTTSLPEAEGGTRQFDYRYSWLRDSAYACATAALLGRSATSGRYLDFVSQLLDQQTDGQPLTPLVTTSAGPAPAESEVRDVAGWASSRPIRVGNDAAGQLQMDSLAAVLEATAVHMRCGGRMTRSTWSVVERLAAQLVATPFGPANGVWEFREPRRLVTEELARWIGLDKAIHLRRLFRPWLRRPDWTRARDATRRRIEAVIDPETGMLPQSFDGPFVADAATLLASVHGFFPRRSELSRRLTHATIAALEEGPFLRRYPPLDDGFDGVEAAFLPASWWAVSALAAIGELDEARRRADAMCAQLPPLQSEEWSVEGAHGLGNTPLLWSHTESARALYNLSTAHLRHRYGRVGAGAWKLGRYARLRFAGNRP